MHIFPQRGQLIRQFQCQIVMGKEFVAFLVTRNLDPEQSSTLDAFIIRSIK